MVLLPFRYRFELLNREIFPVYQDYTDFLLFPTDITLTITLLCWLTALAIGDRTFAIRPKILTGLVGGLTLLSAVSTLFSVDTALSGYHAVRFIALFGFYLYIINEIKGLDQIFVPLLAQIPIQAVFAIVQVSEQRSLGLEQLGELPLDPVQSGVSVILVNGLRYLRAYGLTDHPNILGGSLALGLIVLSGWIASRFSPNFENISGWIFAVAGVYSLGFLALFLTYSRSSWLAWLTGTLFLLLILGKRGLGRHRQAVLGLGLMGIVIIMPFLYQNRDLLIHRLDLKPSAQSSHPAERSVSERNALIQAGNEIFSQAPLTGVGLGAFPIALQQAHPIYPYPYQPPHLVLLEVAAETGIITAVLFGIAMIWPWLVGLTQRKTLQASSGLFTSYALLLAVTSISFFDYYPWLLQTGRLWLWLSWGLWAVMYLQARNGRLYG